MRKEKWIVYRDRCQSLEKKLSLLEPERDRLRKGLVDIKNVYDLNRQSAAYDIARTALESSQPEGREVTAEELSEAIHDTWELEYVHPELCDDIASRLLDGFDVRRR